MAAAPTTFTLLADVAAAASAADTDSVLLDTSELLSIALLRDQLETNAPTVVKSGTGSTDVTALGTAITALVRSRYLLLGPNCIFVPPSGVATVTAGHTQDDIAIQAAIDALQAAVPDQCMGTVLLCGYYYTAAPLITGVVNSAFSRVCITGLGSTVISYVGAAYTANVANYVIRMFGGRNGPKPLLSNLRIFCGSKSRGVLIATPVGSSTVENVHVYGSIESGFDFVECWWMNVRDCAVIEYAGFGARLRQCNGCHYDSLRFWVGAESSTKWPSTTDTICVNYANTAFTTADAERSALMCDDCNGTTFTNLGFENCTYAAYPLVYTDATCLNLRFMGMRLEENVCTLEKMKIVGSDYTVVDGVSTADGLALAGDNTLCDPSVACECFIRCTGVTRGTILNHSSVTPPARIT